MKTSMKMNLAKYVASIGGNLLVELPTNSLEDATSTKVEIFLDRPNRLLIVIDDGAGFDSIEAIDKYLLTIFETGKDESLNFGKGFKTCLVEEFTEIYTHEFKVVMLAWNDIEITDGEPYQEGTKVIVHLKETSELLGKMDMDHEFFLKRYMTSKSIYFQDNLISTTSIDLDGWTKIDNGFIKLGESGHWFKMANDAGYRPAKFNNVETYGVGVIACSVEVVDTERGALRYNFASRVENAWHQYEKDQAYEGAQDISNLAPWIEMARVLFLKLVDEYTTDNTKPTFNTLKTFEQVMLVHDFFSTWKNRMKDDMVEYKFLNLYDSVETDDQRIITRNTPRGESREREAMRYWTGLVNKDDDDDDYEGLSTFFGNITIGIMFENGEPVGPAKISDLAMVDSIVEMDAALEAMDGADLPPFIAKSRDIEFIVGMKDVSIDSLMKDVAGTYEMPDSRFILNRATGIAINDMEEAEPGREPKPGIHADRDDLLEHFRVRDGIPFLVHDNYIEDFDASTKSMESQRAKYLDWKAIITFMLDRCGETIQNVVPCVYATNKDSRNNKANAVTIGPYFAINRMGVNLPTRKEARAQLLYFFALHELAHRFVKGHGAKHSGIMLHLHRAISGKVGFSKSLKDCLVDLE